MTLIRTVLALASFTLPATAIAAAPAPQSIAVEVGDLDLATDKGQRVLALRIQRAATEICKAEALASLPQNIRRQRECSRDTQARAKSEARMVMVTDETARRTGG